MAGALEPKPSRAAARDGNLSLLPATNKLGRGAAAGANNLVLRKHQLDRLKNHTGVRLIVVQAPAGFGKTTLLRQYCAWREAQGSRVAWLHLEAHYADPSRFLRLVCEAVAGAIEEESPSAALPDNSSASIQDFLRVVRGTDVGIVVVVDNFEQAAHSGMEAVIAQLVRVLPQNVQLCIGTRVIPAINLPRLQLREQAVVVNVEGLRFRANETTEFFREFRDISEEELDKYQVATDGWPAALQCIRLSMRGRTGRAKPLPISGVTPDLIDFLATDVFENLSGDIQRALLDACMPERICPELLESISGRPDGEGSLGEIEHLGLFLTPVDMDHRWFRFHTVFRQVLLTRLRRELSEAEILARHRKIAEWYAAHGFSEEAILHYIEATDQEAAAALLNAIIGRLVNEERLDLIVRYTDRLSPDVIQNYEHILNAAIVAYGFRREFIKANRIIALRRAALERENASKEAWGVHHYTRIFTTAAQDQVVEIGRTAQLALDHLADAPGLEYAVALNARAYWLYLNSKFEEAREALAQARALHDEAHNLFGLSYCEWIYANVLSTQGRNEEALKSLKQAQIHNDEGATASVTAGSVIAACLAETLYEKNCIAEAEMLLHDHLLLLEQQAIVEPLALAFLTMARVAMLRGEEREAEEVLDRMMYLGHRYNLRRLVIYAKAELVRQATLAGDLDKARTRFASMGQGENDGEDDLVYFAGETEAQTITEARLLILAGRHADARALLQPAARKARSQRRMRRFLKLNLLLAISLNVEGQVNSARRALIEALQVGAPDQFIRLILDEGPQALRLLHEARAALPKFPDLPQKDSVSAYLDRLLSEAGEFAPALMPDAGHDENDDISPHLLEELTDREREILRLVSNGFSNKALADRLSLSTNTVKWHLRNIFEKLQIGNRMQAVSVARHFGLID
ncbi:regulatory protein LuxR [Parvibaculum lavamentivorans DS-1]|uniref:Regulatory protein LuxR n=1 Tax=Parvibaculum lavamentivorans (strain DS-1 / DSM 13023 / NCIMB 13966) TaxID=402881 RepID=A7HS86_PARL1|nr:LuxR C-terminal-related transcriptional regulator [Parvibaculum lavamentivorans]ABS62769.1 regulatory protein LuxR [Parvibaculum lavamentivorans DS-1]